MMIDSNIEDIGCENCIRSDCHCSYEPHSAECQSMRYPIENDLYYSKEELDLYWKSITNGSEDTGINVFEMF